MPCADASDVDDNGVLDVGDAVVVLSYLFGVFPLTPADPFPSCGTDPTFSDLFGCLTPTYP